MTDGTFDFNANFRERVGFYYDLVKANVQRIVVGLTFELRECPVVALAVTPGWLRSENMLDNFGVTEETWRDALAERPGFAISESPAYVGRGVAALAGDTNPSRYAGRSVTSYDLAKEYGVTDTDGSQPKCWGTSTHTGSTSTADKEWTSSGRPSAPEQLPNECALAGNDAMDGGERDGREPAIRLLDVLSPGQVRGGLWWMPRPSSAARMDNGTTS